MAVSFLGEWDYRPDQLRTFLVAVNGENAQDRVTSIQEEIKAIREKISDLAVRLTADDAWVSEDFADYAGLTSMYDPSDPGFKHTGGAIQLKDGCFRAAFDTVAQLVVMTDPDNTFIAW